MASKSKRNKVKFKWTKELGFLIGAIALIGAVKEKLYTLPDETIVYPGHSESTTIAHEKKYNPFVR